MNRAGSDDQAVPLTLRIEADSDPICGRIEFPDGAALPFSGYMQLVASLERVRTGGRRASMPRAGDDPSAKPPAGDPERR